MYVRILITVLPIHVRNSNRTIKENHQHRRRRPRGSQSGWEKGATKAFKSMLENVRRTFSPDLTNCPWVSEDEPSYNSLDSRSIFQNAKWLLNNE